MIWEEDYAFVSISRVHVNLGACWMVQIKCTVFGLELNSILEKGNVRIGDWVKSIILHGKTKEEII